MRRGVIPGAACRGGGRRRSGPRRCSGAGAPRYLYVGRRWAQRDGAGRLRVWRVPVGG